MSMSRMMLPTEPVIVPMTMATQKGKPNMRLFSTPTTTNRANPMVSKIKKVFSSFHQILFENNHEYEGYGGDSEVAAVDHPEGGGIEQYIAGGTAADGGNQSYGIGAEPVETLGSGQSDAADGKGQCSYNLQYGGKGRIHTRR